MAMNERELQARDAKRDIGAELLQSIRDVKAGKLGKVNLVKMLRAERSRR